jgi:hypothetical protein
VLHVDGFGMIVGHLTRGCILNPNNFVLQNQRSFLSAKCSSERARILVLSSNELGYLSNDMEDVDRKLMVHLNKMQKQNFKSLLDCVVPSNAIMRKIKLKNAVMKIIIEQRVIRNRPSFTTLFRQFRDMGLSNKKISDFLQNSFKKTREQVELEQIDRYIETHNILDKFEGTMQRYLDSLT